MKKFLFALSAGFFSLSSAFGQCPCSPTTARVTATSSVTVARSSVTASVPSAPRTASSRAGLFDRVRNRRESRRVAGAEVWVGVRVVPQPITVGVVVVPTARGNPVRNFVASVCGPNGCR